MFFLDIFKTMGFNETLIERFKKKLQNKKGVAGLDLALEIVILLFIIGLLVMIFTFLGAEIQDQILTTGINNYTVSAGFAVVMDENILSVTSITNHTMASTNTSDGTLVQVGNYTVYPGNNTIAFQATDGYDGEGVQISFTQNSQASKVINETKTSLSSVTDWFGITITMGFIVVLILLTVIIVRNIRGKGGLTASGGNDERSA